MIAYPDTSFLCALYVPQDNSLAAASFFHRMAEPLHVTALLLYEFRQSLRLQVWLHSQNPQKGFSEAKCVAALEKFQLNMDMGAIIVTPADWPAVYQIAEKISVARTKSNGCRAFDVLHVATALHLDAREFLSFDASQRKLAQAEKLKVKP